MPEKTKQSEPDEKEKKREEPREDNEETPGRDQHEKSYYYDDSYGYEVYNPDETEDDAD